MTTSSSAELLMMYRTWVKALLFVIVLLSIGLLYFAMKYTKLKQKHTQK